MSSPSDASNPNARVNLNDVAIGCLEGVRERFLAYGHDLGAKEWAPFYIGELHRFVWCFEPMIERLVQEPFEPGYSESRLRAEVFASIVTAVYTETFDDSRGSEYDAKPQLPVTYPWMPRALFEREEFQAALKEAIFQSAKANEQQLLAEGAEVVAEPIDRVSWQKPNSYLDRVYARHHGRMPLKVEKLEKLLIGARAWARTEVREAASKGYDLAAIKDLVVKRTYDDFVPKHISAEDFGLEYGEFEAALWEEGSPSLEDLARAELSKDRSNHGRALRASANEAQVSADEGDLSGVRVSDPIEQGPSYPGRDGFELKKAIVLRDFDLQAATLAVGHIGKPWDPGACKQGLQDLATLIFERSKPTLTALPSGVGTEKDIDSDEVWEVVGDGPRLPARDSVRYSQNPELFHAELLEIWRALQERVKSQMESLDREHGQKAEELMASELGGRREVESGRSTDIQIDGPDDAELRMFPHGEFYLWKVHNGGLGRVENLQFRVDSIQTFDSKKRAFREPVPDFNFRWPVIKTLAAGDDTPNIIFVRYEGDYLGFGNSTGMHRLPWPGGDPTSIRRWLLSMRIGGLSKEWLIELDLRWVPGARTLEVGQYAREAEGPPMNAPSPQQMENASSIPASISESEDYARRLPSVPPDTPPTLDAALAEAEKLAANVTQRRQFRVVTLYGYYLLELKTLKAERGRKPGKLSGRKTLKERFPWLEVWVAMNPEEIDQIETLSKLNQKDFVPNNWARSLVCAHERLTGLSPRSIINYRKALTKARSSR